MFASDINVYEEMVCDETQKSNFIQEQSLQYPMLLKQERIAESLVVGEEIVVGGDHLFGETDCQETDTTMYFNHDLENCNKINIKYEESGTSIPLTESSIVDKWDCEDIDISSLKGNEYDNASSEQDTDEETIATFVTATGQQLALYAVEDSEEIYAVALYDESGKPPTNFQFLMKADVERLIGEGAVRTVKKPTQMKKRLLTTQSYLHSEDFEEMVEQAHVDVNNGIITHDMSIDDKCIDGSESYETEYDYKTTSHQNYSDFATIASNTSNDIIYNTVDKQPDVTTYLLMNDRSNNIEYKVKREEPYSKKHVLLTEQTDEIQDAQEVRQDEELMERSTVQYILFDEEQSDSELTFDEIQRTLENLRKPRRKGSRDASADSSERSDSKSQDDYSCIKREVLYNSSMEIDSSLEMDTIHNETQSLSFTPRTPSDNESDDRQRLIDTLTDSPPSTEKAQPRLKRSRKQQLTSMNRDDGEIIIQPASLLSEEELTGKKRGRRRRPRPPQVRIEHGHASKKIKRKKRQKVVEVIDLDVDEEEQRNVVIEITLDDSRDDGKYSSDKENEIIMVRDSDDDEDEGEEEEEEEEHSGALTKLSGAMQCKHCSRGFRQRRALDTHLRVCEKSPENARKLDKRKAKGKQEQAGRKQYACKICQEKFDVVVALARHVRAEHSQRKKQRWAPTSQKTQDKSLRSVQQRQQAEHEEEDADIEGEEEEDNEGEKERSEGDDAEKTELRMLGKVKGKEKDDDETCSWETDKFRCVDCGRCYSSSALLSEHSLLHGAKKSEPQRRKCHICKKIMKSRLLLLRHIKMHNASRCSAGSSHMLRRRLRARPSTRIMSLRKRGRPRKF
ncbi:PREDICTED: glutamic acid-rich protein-like [Dinoponera quadriceps]|uniref:Glutamic acid-rich protein-like n=1 Tax=Dinoponera quadriceps TaxID=609295 RepID=A0A6P3X030_DINQU|nr:PREDICTED: glutamic acid-rich protein-like [Dinoponera quadriceps]XP_014471717.1 PREDICTED: glutamic acid-rich protein-like [Dinoponera quadriceps]